MTKRMGPGDVPSTPGPPTQAHHEGEEALDMGRVYALHHDDEDDEMSLDDIREQLAKLREPFPPDRIEKLPKPKWRDAWKDLKGSNCPVCGGYHVLQHCIHLDYVGHANVTDRLLEIDPFWEWEPMAYTPEGLPLFVKEGLWIRLTVCGVTRIGFGDGASIKEVIGDAIRNAAMRFGVGLDLWAKIDLHAERNPGDGKASTPRGGQTAGRGGVGEAGDRPERGGGSVPGDASRGEGEAVHQGPGGPSQAPTRAPNQDALDALGAVCDENGIPRRSIRQSFLNWAAKTGQPQGDIVVAESADIEAFTLHLIESMEPPEAGVDGRGPGGAEATVGAGDAGHNAEASAGGGPSGVDSAGADEAQSDLF